MIAVRPLLLLAACSLAAAGLSPARAADRERRRDRDKPVATAAASGAPVSPASGFEAFDLLATRNIFDPNRVGRTRASPEEKPPRVDEISLVGTLQYNRGQLAFFDSPDPAYKKALHEGESVGDFKVQRIAPDGVELVRGDKPVTLKVTQQLRRPEGGDWTVTSTQPPAPAADPDAARNAAAAAAAEIPADASDALKRLLEKRKNQLK